MVCDGVLLFVVTGVVVVCLWFVIGVWLCVF